MSSLIPLLKTPPPPETAPRAQKKTKLAKVMAKTRLGDGEFDLGVLLAKVPGKSLVQEGINFLINLKKLLTCVGQMLKLEFQIRSN